MISPGQGHTNDIMTLISDVDLSILTEEVLETVFAGYNFQRTLTQTLTESTFDKPGASPEVPHIAIIVDINKTDNYVFRTQPGAWRRVLMNLFGNALKYTPAGYIKIKLQVTRSSTLDEFSELRLIITDSGIGMSEDYVNNRLFHSFAQENSLSQGTGLGLSIVKQIVESLGGDIEVRSEKDKGTKFTVSCPLKQSTLSPAVQPSTELLSIAQRASGMNVVFIGFDDEDEYFPIKSLKNKNASRMTTKALDNLCTDWFGLNVQKHDAVNAPAPDLFIATESGAKWLRAQYNKNSSEASTAPVIVLCQGPASAKFTTAITVPGQIFECIAQPCGPHKLAKALTSCLDRHAKQLTAIDSALSNISKLTLQENTPPMSPTRLSPPALDVPRPHFVSALSAPELRSLNSSPVKKVAKPKALRCLAVDDNPINLRLLRMFIEKLNHKHTLAVNGLEALEIYKASNLPGLPHPSPESTKPPSPTSSPRIQNQTLASLPLPSPTLTIAYPTETHEHDRIDVILMDINMPVLDGLEATRQIRSHERDHGLPPVTIIALTGVASSEAQQEAHVSGVNLFLIKPVRLGDLEVVLKGVV
jgi:CheY-like chemotaxis protein